MYDALLSLTVNYTEVASFSKEAVFLKQKNALEASKGDLSSVLNWK